VIGLSRRAPADGGATRHVACDLAEAAATAEALRPLAPDVVLHAQAMADVDQCEVEPDAAWRENVRTLEHLVASLDLERTLLIFISTDQVFDGTKGTAYDETDAPHPLGAYGRAKLAAEQAALRCPRSVVVRTSTLFGEGRMNFCHHIVARVTAGEPVEAFTDQVTSPTYTEDLAEALEELSRTLMTSWDPTRPRLFHITNSGGASRVAFAERVAELVGAPRELIRGIPMAAQQRPAKRPPYSALTSRYLEHTIGRTLRRWDDAVFAYLRHRHWVD